MQTHYSNSLVGDSFIVKPLYIATRIFESLFESDHSFSNIIGPFKPKEHSLIGKHPFSTSFLHTFSIDMKHIFKENILRYSQLFEAEKMKKKIETDSSALVTVAKNEQSNKEKKTET